MERTYRIGQVYRDRAGVKFENDEFLRWLHHQRTIANAGGIRWRDFLSLTLVDPHTGRKIPCYIVLVTVRKRSQYQNPWEDVISTRAIRYWGDAKLDSTKNSYLDFRGNQMLVAAARASSLGAAAIPPILHFTKFENGWVQFNGLCWLSGADVEHFKEGGRQVENLVLNLSVLDVDNVPVRWLKERSSSSTLEDSNRSAPEAWLEACAGGLIRVNSRAIKPYALAIAERGFNDDRTNHRITPFEPTNMLDGRSRVLAQIVQRQGQALFRARLFKNYGARCAITGCSVPQILEACHIRPYLGRHTNHPSNGILFRADIHTLFDQGLLGVEPTSMKIVVSQALKGTEYESWHGRSLRLPSIPAHHPNFAALQEHYLEMGALIDRRLSGQAPT